jgi:hypothetical protein
MEIIYKAFDGTHFKTEEECRNYESKATFSMWDNLGRPIDSTYDCVVVYFSDPMGSRAFINLAKEEDAAADGIDCDDYGWFIWDDFNGEYHYVEDGIIDALRKILSEKPRR